MADKLTELLNEKIEAELNALDQFGTDSAEHQNAVENVVKLYKLRIDEAKADMDYREKREQMVDEAIGRYVKLGAEIAGVILPLLFYGYWMRKGLEFEKTGTFASDTFRGLIRWFKPVKK